MSLVSRRRKRPEMEMDQLEGRFYEYMYHLGQADEDWNRGVLEFYVPYFAHCHRVLDVGCGQGQFIELLKAEGVAAAGIDADTRMVEVCRGKGLDVVRADLFNYLPQQKEQFDGIFSSNLIEHFSAQDAIRFVRMAFGVLVPGGIVLVSTPNPGSLIVHLNEFWRDATHVRLYSRSLLEFLCAWAGFEGVQSGENPRTIWTPSPGLQAVPELLDSLSTRKRFRLWNAVAEKTRDTHQRPPLRRLIFSLRRRLARFLAQTVLFEEFDAVADAVATLWRVERALYESGSRALLAAREIYVRGTKPSVGSEES
jgi:SAM-dependent methyltransferase